jgi:hypothetical protein
LQSKVFADATARDAAITVPTTGMVVYLTSPGALSLYRGGAWRQMAETSDTGWITTGMTAGTTGVTITSQRYRILRNSVSLYVQGTMGATLAGLLNADTNNTSGDIIPNQTVLQLPAAAFPAKLAPLNTGHLGATLTWAVDVDGTVSAVAGIPSATYAATSVFSVGGTYLLD